MLDQEQPRPPTLDAEQLAEDIAQRVIVIIERHLASPREEPPALLTTAEVANRLSISERTLGTLCAMGEIPFVRVGTRGRGSRRFSSKDVDAYIRRRAATGTS